MTRDQKEQLARGLVADSIDRLEQQLWMRGIDFAEELAGEAFVAAARVIDRHCRVAEAVSGGELQHI